MFLHIRKVSFTMALMINNTSMAHNPCLFTFIAITIILSFFNLWFVFVFYHNSWFWSPNTLSFRVSKVTSQRQSIDGMRWFATCVWIPSWSHRCPLWQRCAPNSSVAFQPLFTMVLWVSKYRNTQNKHRFGQSLLFKSTDSFKSLIEL